MDDLLAFAQLNWFNLFQTLGIVASLVFTAMTLRGAARERRMTALLTLQEQHRELWSQLHQRPDLVRVLDVEVDLVGNPLSAAEREFLNTVFVHYCTGWRLAKDHRILALEDLQRDLLDFLSRPVPAQVWKDTVPTRERGFVDFVHQARAARAARAPRSAGPGFLRLGRRT